MIVIDGKEAGGQILRTALGLSTITGKPIKVINIRGARQGGVGLKTQHLEGMLAVAQLCNAEVKGAKLGSTEIEFIPKKLENRELNIKIPTAGSIGLLFQSLQIPVAFTDDTIQIHITGGSTASAWSPTLEYIQNVFLPIVRKMEYVAELEIVKYGFYPKGGAEVNIVVYPTKKLNSINLTDRGKVKGIFGISVAGSLPQHVAERQANAARKIFSDYGLENIHISSQAVDTLSPGTSITLWAECENTILGSDNIGKRGVPAEKIAEQAAKELISSIESQACLDKYMGDQIIPFIALAENKSKIKVEEITQHCKTNILVCEQLLGVRFNIDATNKTISVNGIGFQRSSL